MRASGKRWLLIGLDRNDRRVVVLLAASWTSDIADAHVVICARRSEQHIVTYDPGDLRVLDPAVRLMPSDRSREVISVEPRTRRLCLPAPAAGAG